MPPFRSFLGPAFNLPPALPPAGRGPDFRLEFKSNSSCKNNQGRALLVGLSPAQCRVSVCRFGWPQNVSLWTNGLLPLLEAGDPRVVRERGYSVDTTLERILECSGVSTRRAAKSTREPCARRRHRIRSQDYRIRESRCVRRRCARAARRDLVRAENGEAAQRHFQGKRFVRNVPRSSGGL